MKASEMIAGLAAAVVLQWSVLPLHAQEALKEPLPGYCLTRLQSSAFEIKQKKVPGFFRIKTGVFCTTPIPSSNGNLVTGCDDGQVRFISNAGALIRSIKIDHDPDAGISSNPEVVAIPHTKPEQYVVTSSIDQIVIRFDSSGKVLSKTKLDAEAGKPVGLTNSSYFVADSDGVGHFYPHQGSPVSLEMQSSYLNDPTPRVNAMGENQIVISDGQGNLFILAESGEIKKIPLSAARLGNTKIAPDGRVWVSDSNGIMYVVDVETQEVQTINMAMGKIFTSPVFLSNGKIAFGSGDYIFIFNSNHLQHPEAVYDAKINNEDYRSGLTTHYLGTLMDHADLAVMPLEDGKEYIWVPTHGGYHLINDQGGVVAVFKYGSGDAETYSSPLRLSDGSFTIGMFYGIDRVVIKKSSVGIASGSWMKCQE